MIKIRLACLCALALLACHAGADVVLAPLFTDGAVLQRDKPIPVWGVAGAGEKITVTFAGNTVSTTAGADGKWRVDLPAMPASFESRALAIKGKNTITLNDILVGEVWLASGQSNMEWWVANTHDAQFEEIAGNHPHVRQFFVPLSVAREPASAIGTEREPASLCVCGDAHRLTIRTPGIWTPATTESVGQFSAVGYFFALDLRRALGVPVGIINSSWGGTRVEAWMDAASADASHGPVFASIHERWAKTLADFPKDRAGQDAAIAKWMADRDAAKSAGKPFTTRHPRIPWGPGHQATPSGLYNAMIHPLIPYALRGVIWYQGESNAPRAGEYHKLFSAMITGWRARFDQGNFPFYWVQLANFRDTGVNNTAYAFLRGAQTDTLALPNTGQAVTIDIGNVTDIHPRNKRDVGRRLALLALARDYGKTELVDSGPVYESAVVEGSAMRVRFKKSPSPLTSPLGETPAGFELAGKDGIFHPAEAKIDRASVIVTSPSVPAPVAVRYAWRNAPAAGLFNRNGLPACPFRSDDW